MVICEDKLYTKLVWVAVALSILQAMREARQLDKANTVPTPFLFINLSKGDRKGKVYLI